MEGHGNGQHRWQNMNGLGPAVPIIFSDSRFTFRESQILRAKPASSPKCHRPTGYCCRTRAASRSCLHGNSCFAVVLLRSVRPCLTELCVGLGRASAIRRLHLRPRHGKPRVAPRGTDASWRPSPPPAPWRAQRLANSAGWAATGELRPKRAAPQLRKGWLCWWAARKPPSLLCPRQPDALAPQPPGCAPVAGQTRS